MQRKGVVKDVFLCPYIMPKGQTTFKHLTKLQLQEYLDRGVSLAEIGRK